jgi:predicted nucleic acid-binding protein
MRVMLDTNILISVIVLLNDRMDGLIYKTALDHWLVLSSYIILEFLEKH